MTPRKTSKSSAIVERTPRVPWRVNFFQRHPADDPREYGEVLALVNEFKSRNPRGVLP
jgi:hypothetical protein